MFKDFIKLTLKSTNQPVIINARNIQYFASNSGGGSIIVMEKDQGVVVTEDFATVKNRIETASQRAQI